MKKTTIPDLLLVFIALQFLTHYLIPVTRIIRTPYIYLGIPLILLGLYWNWVWIPNRFKKENTTTDPNVIPNKLITDGPFSITRNPTYFGMAITLLGISILLGSIITFIFPIIFVILVDKTVIPIEEKNLKNKFGKKYLKYKKRVRRWI